MKRNNIPRTLQELYDFFGKIKKLLDICTDVIMLIVTAVLLYDGIEGDAPSWLMESCLVVAIIAVIALVVSIGIGVKLRLLKKKLGGMKIKKGQETEYEKE